MTLEKSQSLTKRTSKVSVIVEDSDDDVSADKTIPRVDNILGDCETGVRPLRARSRSSNNVKPRASSGSLYGTAGTVLEKQGRLTDTMLRVWFIMWAIGTIFTGVLIILARSRTSMPMAAHGQDWIVVALVETPVLLYCAVINRLGDYIIISWSRRRFAAGSGSLAIIGYLNTSVLKRTSFLSSLSYRSKLRSSLIHIARLQFVLSLLPVLAIYASGGVKLVQFTTSGQGSCYVFTTAAKHTGVISSYNYASGVADYVVTAALGNLRVDGSPSTVGVLGPDSESRSDWYAVRGSAVLVGIASKCTCDDGGSQAWKTLYAATPIEGGPETLPNVNTTIADGVAVATTWQESADGSFVLNQELYDGDLCGGTGSRLMCATKGKFDLGVATVEYQASSGGLAPGAVSVSDVSDAQASFTPNKEFYDTIRMWYSSMNSTRPMTRSKSNRAPPLLQWMSRGGGGLSVSLADAGIEVMNILLMTQALSITQLMSTSTCTTTSLGNGSVMTMSSYTIVVLVVLGTISLLCGIGASILTYLDDKDPTRLSVCSRIHTDTAVMIQATSQSAFISTQLSNMCNAEPVDIWNVLDRKAAIGEDVSGLDDEVGHITIGTAKTIRPLQLGRRYAGTTRRVSF